MENTETIQQVTKSESLGNIATALNKAQAEIGAVTKGEKGYGYNYASLASTIEVSKPSLVKHGLAVTQLVGGSGNAPSVTTILLHAESGEFIQGTISMDLVEMKGVNTAQQAGATLTYARRYALQAILNMASEDTDASSKGAYKPTTSSLKSPAKKDAPKKEAAPAAGSKTTFNRKKKAAPVEEAPKGDSYGF